MLFTLHYFTFYFTLIFFTLLCFTLIYFTLLYFTLLYFNFNLIYLNTLNSLNTSNNLNTLNCNRGPTRRWQLLFTRRRQLLFTKLGGFFYKMPDTSKSNENMEYQKNYIIRQPIYKNRGHKLLYFDEKRQNQNFGRVAVLIFVRGIYV